MNIKPDWSKIHDQIGTDHSPSELNRLWEIECDKWLQDLVNHFGTDYKLEDSKNFTVMSNEGDRYIELFLKSMERNRSRILSALKGIASDKGYGKHVVLIFKDADQYYDYLGLHYASEGDFGASAGVYINDGYGHFAFPSQQIELAENISVHELTHALTAHLPLPVWLSEGLALLIEDHLTIHTLEIDTTIMAKHQRYWNEKSIQHFWTGESFQATDQGQELSYHLSHILIRNLAKSDGFLEFANEAHMHDAGEAAANTHLNISLAQLISLVFGDGDWGMKNSEHSPV